MLKHFLDITEDERIERIEQLNEKKFRLNQLLETYFSKGSIDPPVFTTIPNHIREELVKTALPDVLNIEKRVYSDNDRTIKYLLRLNDGNNIEAVLMLYPDSSKPRATLCISSQVGCNIGCPFCATGKMGRIRNLLTSEIVEQFRQINNEMNTDKRIVRAKKNLKAITNVVFMGMGEPLQNFDNVLSSIKYLSGQERRGFGLSVRNITLSTSGFVPKIYDLIKEDLRFRLAISLHSAINEKRNDLVPLNKAYNVDTLLKAGLDFFRATKVRVSIEYALMRDVNDTKRDAEILAKKLKELGDLWVHVNLIPLSEVEGSNFKPSTNERTKAFVKTLEDSKIPVTLRNSRGEEESSACGQLATQNNCN